MEGILGLILYFLGSARGPFCGAQRSSLWGSWVHVGIPLISFRIFVLILKFSWFWGSRSQVLARCRHQPGSFLISDPLSLSPGGHQWYHISPGPAHGKAIRWWRPANRFPCGGSVSGRHRHQRRTWTDLLPGDRNAQCAQQSGPGLLIILKKKTQYSCVPADRRQTRKVLMLGR